MLDLTIAQRRGARLVPLAALAEAQNIPAGFLEQILLRLRQGGFLASTRGKNGGYSGLAILFGFWTVRWLRLRA